MGDKIRMFCSNTIDMGKIAGSGDQSSYPPEANGATKEGGGRGRDGRGRSLQSSWLFQI